MQKVLFTNLYGYKKSWLQRDFMAALIVTAIAIPESLGYAALVGLPVQAGLYCALLAPLIFAMFASTKHLVVGADSATTALVATGAASLAIIGTTQYGNAVAVLGLLTAAVLIAMAAARLGFLANLISRPVLIGFMSGVGIQLIIGKLPEMLGLKTSGSLLHKAGFLLTNLSDIQLGTTLLSVAVVGIVVIGWKLSRPGALIALLLATASVKLFNLQYHGIAVVGSVPAGFPAVRIPIITVHMIETLLPVAFAIALVVLAQSLAVTRSSAARYEEKVDDNQNLLALGLANASSALTGGFAINGSPPRTSAGEMAGGRSQLINVMMAGSIGIILLVATKFFGYVPTACLAAIVFTIGLHLVKFGELRDILAVRGSEFAIAMVALGGVALLGVERGVVIAVVISLVDQLRRQYHPHDELLLRDQRFADWASDRVSPKKNYFDAPAGVLVYRFNDSLFFENSGYFMERCQQMLADAKEPVKYFVLDAGAISDIDYTSAEVLKRLYNQLDTDDIQLALAHVPPMLRTLLDRYGLTTLIGEEHIYTSVREAIDTYTRIHVSSADRIHALDLPKDSFVVISGAAMELRGIRETNDVDLVVSKSTYATKTGKNTSWMMARKCSATTATRSCSAGWATISPT